MDNGYILIVVLLAGIAGRRSIARGCIAGIATGIVFFFVFDPITWKSFFISLCFSIAASVIASVLSYILLPGIKGGGNTGPSYLGGGRHGSHPAGIINTNEELKARKQNQSKIP